MHSNPHIFTLTNVSSKFEGQGSRLALKDISLSVDKGSFVSAIGPSGAGKSTLLRIILGLLPETSGTIERNFKNAGMVFQNHALFPWLTVLENTAFGLHMEGMAKAEREKIAMEKIREVGL